MAEDLSVLIREASLKSLSKGYLVGKLGVEVNLLQYADNTIFVGEQLLITW